MLLYDKMNKKSDAIYRKGQKKEKERKKTHFLGLPFFFFSFESMTWVNGLCARTHDIQNELVLINS